jgi:hypothetical protein
MLDVKARSFPAEESEWHAAFRALTSEPVQTLGVVRLYQAARLAAGGEGTDTQDPAILGQMGEFLEVCRTRKGARMSRRGQDS